jgi:8-oxo-dGTP pyrophosphatase MutT (NUDIX family)
MHLNLEQIRIQMMRQLADYLPGKEAHLLLQPSNRIYYEKIPEKAQLSAVMLILHPVEEDLHIIAILRPQYDGIHGGQVAFPGGKKENKDASLQDTAIRETEEEIGFQIAKQHILGYLTDIYIPISNFRVRPFVTLINKLPELHTNPLEVENTIDISCNDLVAEKAVQFRKLETHRYGNLVVPCFVMDNQIIWGATAMILSELREILLKIK